MSAFVCSDYHISVLAVYATSRRSDYVYHKDERVDLNDAEEIAGILHAQNVRSVNALYREEEQAGFIFDRDALRYVTIYSSADVIKSAQCYTYQACETDDYQDTLAHRIIEFIISKAIRRLPGYEDAEWGFTHPGERLAAKRAELRAPRGR
jgi:hypothetical protein